MGRNVKSEAEKKLNGNRGKRKISQEVDIDLIMDATPLKGMGKAQKDYWGLYAPFMIKAGLLTDLNKTDLAKLCFYESQLDAINKALSKNFKSLLQEKKNYHGESVDIVESVYSRLSRNYIATIRILKADLRLRTDKQSGTFRPKPKSKVDSFMGRKNGTKG
jgi:hypothetical protein